MAVDSPRALTGSGPSLSGSDTAVQSDKWPAVRRDQVALEWVRRGVAVFPVNWIRPDGECACGRGGCGSPGKDPVGRLAPHGVKDATKDLDQVQAWWRQSPYANIGLAMGAISGVWALDVDVEHGGDETLWALEQANGKLPDTPVVYTGGGGRHLFFRYDKRVRNTAGELGPGLDTRSDHGYVVGAGSNHRSGRSYVDDVEYTFGEVEPAPAPEWLLDMLEVAGQRKDEPGSLPAVWDKERNNRLFREACNLRRRGWSEDEITKALIVLDLERCKPPKGEAYCKDMARRVCRRYAPAGELEQWMSDLKEADIDIDPRPTGEVYPLTEFGNRDRLVDRHGHNLRYCPELGWLIWDGVAWMVDRTRAIREIAMEVIYTLHITEKDMHLTPPDSKGNQKDRLPDWIIKSSTKRGIDAMVDLASHHPRIAVTVDDLDRQPWMYTVRNGTIDLVTGTLTPPKREHLITVKAPVVYDPRAKAPRWTRFVNEVLRHNANMVRFMQCFFGYALTGSTAEAVMPIMYGQGSNGKSVMLDTLMSMMGPSAMSAPATTFDANRRTAIPNDIAAMRSARLVVATETEDRVTLEMALVKRITGGDKLVARFLHKEFFSFTPTMKVVMATNNLPEIRGADHGSWRRIAEVRFDVQFGSPEGPPAENKDHLLASLDAERSGIFNWCLEGCLLWQREGLVRPEEVLDATAEYRDQQDILGPFLDECIRRTVGRDTPKVDVYKTYARWCEANGHRAIGSKSFGQQMMAHGFAEVRRNASRMWTNCELLDLKLERVYPFGVN